FKAYREMVKELQLLRDMTMSPNVLQFYEEPDGMNSMSVVHGHPPYVEPLCFKGNYWPDARSDIYSLGVVLWELSSGRPPMTQISPSAIGYNVVMGMRESPIIGTPDSYVQLYTECWDGKPENRPNIDSVYDRIKFIEWPEETDDVKNLNMEFSDSISSSISELITQEKYYKQYPNLAGFSYQAGLGTEMDSIKAKPFYEMFAQNNNHWLL
ncbi:991_t:CDS:2, partial [Ambispora gerdemannii]